MYIFFDLFFLLFLGGVFVVSFNFFPSSLYILSLFLFTYSFVVQLLILLFGRGQTSYRYFYLLFGRGGGGGGGGGQTPHDIKGCKISFQRKGGEIIGKKFHQERTDPIYVAANIRQIKFLGAIKILKKATTNVGVFLEQYDHTS